MPSPVALDFLSWSLYLAHDRVPPPPFCIGCEGWGGCGRRRLGLSVARWCPQALRTLLAVAAVSISTADASTLMCKWAIGPVKILATVCLNIASSLALPQAQSTVLTSETPELWTPIWSPAMTDSGILSKGLNYPSKIALEFTTFKICCQSVNHFQWASFNCYAKFPEGAAIVLNCYFT